MSTVSSIFNSTFFVFLGIIVLIVGLLIIYFENKSREQNHKISSMLSLVSSLAEELNMVKFHLNRMNMVGSGMSMNNLSVPVTTNIPINSSETINLGERLIEVSDNEDEEDEDVDDDEEDEDVDDDEDDDEQEDEDVDDDDNEVEDEDDDGDEDVDDEENEQFSITELPLDDIKILNINDFKANNSDEDDDEDDEDNDDEVETMNDIDDEDDLTMNDIDDIDEETIELINMTHTFDIEELEITKSEVKTPNDDNNKEITLLNLEKSKNIEVIDYKKLSLNKLRSVVLEKGLVTDSSKLKKNELFKLLGVE